MGLSLFKTSSCGCKRGNEEVIEPKVVRVKAQNPNPTNFEFIRSDVEGGFVIVEIRYIGCTNYEGRKILVFKNHTVESILNSNNLDPHFCDGKNCISPIARFAPTDEGWDMAIILAKTFDIV